MNNKLYFYFPVTNYFGHNPQHKFINVENNQDYDKLVTSDPDCIIFRSGGEFYAIVTVRTFVPPIEINDGIESFVNFPGVCMIAKCSNRIIEQYYRSNELDETIYNQVIALITIVISLDYSRAVKN